MQLERSTKFQSLLLKYVPNFSIVGGAAETVTADSVGACVMKCLRQTGCHSVEMQMNITVDNCVLYGGDETEVVMERVDSDIKLYSVFNIPSNDMRPCN